MLSGIDITIRLDIFMILKTYLLIGTTIGSKANIIGTKYDEAKPYFP